MIKFKRLTIALLALLSISATAWAQTTVTWTEADLTGSGSDLTTYTKDGVTIKCSDRISSGKSFNGPVTISTTLGNFTKIEITGQGSAPIASDIFTNDGNTATWTGNASSLNFPNAIAYATQFVFTIVPSGPEVTITGTSTEGQQAEFDMPQYDVTVTYTLKRDLSVETQVTVQDEQQNTRFRVEKKQGGGYQPYGKTSDEVKALFKVHDQIENEDLNATDDYTVLIYPVDENGQILSGAEDGIPFENFTYAPGHFVVKAQGQGNYVGQTLESNVFTLYEGYELTVAPGDYATYYRTDDALYVDDPDAQLYTITAVSGQTATAEPISVAPAGTPVLVKNNSTDPEKTTVLLIPTTTDADVNFYAGFVGTLEATTIAASDAATDRYALNGQQFVWVKNPVSIAANKAWLEVPTGAAAGARAINIVFGEATGVSEVIEANGVTDDTFYDLNGRKVAVPNKKGIYIQNGKKVVVK